MLLVYKVFLNSFAWIIIDDAYKTKWNLNKTLLFKVRSNDRIISDSPCLWGMQMQGESLLMFHLGDVESKTQ